MSGIKRLTALGTLLMVVGAAVMVGVGGTGRASVDVASSAAMSTEAPSDEHTDEHTDESAEAATTTTSTTTGAADDVTVERDDHSVPEPVPPVHDVIAGAPASPPADPAAPIGALNDGLANPDLDLTAFPGSAPAPQPTVDGPDGFTTGPGCHGHCITRGDAYARGFGALIVAETDVPARIFLSVVADTDGDGDQDDDTHFTQSDHLVESLEWELDDLVPGQTYYGMVAATDANGHTDHRFGEFTTLSTRTVQMVVGDTEIVGGPDDIVTTTRFAAVDGGGFDDGEITDGANWITATGVGDHVDASVRILRRWDADLCEVVRPDSLGTYGSDGDACITWNTASTSVDMTRAAAGRSHWSVVTIPATLSTPASAGGALPPGYGQPRYFHADVDVTFVVIYS